MMFATFIMLLGLALADAWYKGDIRSEETNSGVRDNAFSDENNDRSDYPFNNLLYKSEYADLAHRFLKFSLRVMEHCDIEECYRQCYKEKNGMVCMTICYFELKDDVGDLQEDDIQSEDESLLEEQDSHLDSKSYSQEEQESNPESELDTLGEQGTTLDPNPHAELNVLKEQEPAPGQESTADTESLLEENQELTPNEKVNSPKEQD